MKRSPSLSGMFVLTVVVSATAQPPGGRGGAGGQGGVPGGGRPVSPIIEALDVNHDGVISVDELKNAPASLLTLDKNKDGKLTEDEYRPQFGRGGTGGVGGAPGGRGGEGGRPGGQGGPGGPGGGPNAERMFEHAMQFDADGDGKLSQDELKKFIEDFVRRGPAGGGARGGAEGRGGGARPGESERPRRPN